MVASLTMNFGTIQLTWLTKLWIIWPLPTPYLSILSLFSTAPAILAFKLLRCTQPFPASGYLLKLLGPPIALFTPFLVCLIPMAISGLILNIFSSEQVSGLPQCLKAFSVLLHPSTYLNLITYWYVEIMRARYFYFTHNSICSSQYRL